MSQLDPIDLELGAASEPEDAPRFASILGRDFEAPSDEAAEPECFHDLNLDQVVAAIVRGRDEYNLVPFFRTALRDRATAAFRQDVFRDLQDRELRSRVEAFAEQMHQTRSYLNLVEQQRFKYEKERWFLDAAQLYYRAVEALHAALGGSDLTSEGFRALRHYLAAYVDSNAYTGLAADEQRVRAALDKVRYALRIKGTRITVGPYDGETDYSAEVEETFARFRQADATSHLIRILDSGSMDHVEAEIVERVARLNPAEFQALDRFCADHTGFLDGLIVRFDREVQFYLSYLAHTDGLRSTGASFCLPTIGAGDESSATDAFDLALAGKLIKRGGKIVRNNFSLRRPERIVVVSGPNQGGKTTFSRMFGQLHYLAALGVPVPAREATLFLPDRVFVHFERQEDISTLRGKLDDELFRMKEILGHATAQSVLVVNEIFASTTLDDAVTLGLNVMRQVVEIGCVALFVTFVDELASFGAETVSMVATVDPTDPARRTFEVVRKPADGRAYALAIAEKYGLTYEQINARVAR